MTDRPLVSVGLPVYNGERYLPLALEAHLAQDVEDLELILCDNASTDSTSEICREAASRDPRVRYHRNGENIGAAANYNRVAELARGTWFRWATHDDLVAPSHLRRCLEAFEGGPPGAVLAYPRTAVIDADGELAGDYEDGAECLSPRPHQRLRKLMRNLSLCNPVLGLARLETVRRTQLIGPYRSSDKVYLYEMALMGEILEVPERLFLRRRHASLASPSNLSPDERTTWWDPRRSPDPWYRRTLVAETFGAIRRARLGPLDRARCYAVAARDAVRWRRQMLGEWRAARRAGRSAEPHEGGAGAEVRR